MNFPVEQMNGVINIPVDTLRSKLNELPKDAPIFVYCAIGLKRIFSTTNFIAKWV